MCKKIDFDKMSIFINFFCVDSISSKLKNNFLKLHSQRPSIYQINGNSMRNLMDLSDLKYLVPLYEGGNLIFARPLFLQIPLYHGE